MLSRCTGGWEVSWGRISLGHVRATALWLPRLPLGRRSPGNPQKGMGWPGEARAPGRAPQGQRSVSNAGLQHPGMPSPTGAQEAAVAADGDKRSALAGRETCWGGESEVGERAAGCGQCCCCCCTALLWGPGPAAPLSEPQFPHPKQGAVASALPPQGRPRAPVPTPLGPPTPACQAVCPDGPLALEKRPDCLLCVCVGGVVVGHDIR